MTENNAGEPSTHTSEGLLLAGFERLPTAKKVSVFEDIIYALNEDLRRFNDPVLVHNLDILDGICCNIEQRLEEIKEIYGME
jgi:hypothetical protein